MRSSFVKKIGASIVSVAALSFPAYAEKAPANKTASVEAKDQASLLDSYIKIQQALASDSLDKAQSAANELGEAAAKKKDAALQERAKKIASAKNISEAREEFKGLFEPMRAHVKDEKDLHPVFCPMAKGRWYQHGKKVNNPYYGKSMADCGVIEKK